jgi:hypothetical protein
LNATKNPQINATPYSLCGLRMLSLQKSSISCFQQQYMKLEAHKPTEVTVTAKNNEIHYAVIIILGVLKILTLMLT